MIDYDGLDNYFSNLLDSKLRSFLCEHLLEQQRIIQKYHEREDKDVGAYCICPIVSSCISNDNSIPII